MKAFTLFAGLLLAVSAHAGFSGRAPLIARHLKRSTGGDAWLICEYSNSHARFEILSQNGKCAPYLIVQ